MKEYLRQESGFTCFVVAVYNSLVHRDLPPFDFDEGVKVAGAENGAAFHRSELIRWSKAPLVEAGDYRDVLMRGGVLNIMHPIYNGHALFVFPDGEWTVTLVNSWLGPHVMTGIGWDEIEPFIAERRKINLGTNFVLTQTQGLTQAMSKIWGVGQ